MCIEHVSLGLTIEISNEANRTAAWIPKTRKATMASLECLDIICLNISDLTCKNHKLVLESDSSLAVYWLNSPYSCPSSFKPLILHCLSICEGLEWYIKHVPRDCNILADNLAKKEISRSEDLCQTSFCNR
ncbi:hypothetical protein GQ457_09G030920 [Hibiscus cannabinus]